LPLVESNRDAKPQPFEVSEWNCFAVYILASFEPNARR